MVAQGYISQNQANQAMTVDIMSQVHPLVSKYQNIQDPYFVLAAKQQLIDKYGAGTVQLGGWKVITTLNLAQQAESEKLINQNLPAVERAGGDEEATVVENVHTGQITSLIGGINFNNPNYGQINYAAGALIEPGSSFKPYVYATLINNNTDVGAGSVLYDSQGPIPGYPCTDKAVPDSGGNCLWDDNLTYPGPETLRYALGGSRNVPAVKAMVEADPNDHSASRVQSVNLALNTASKMMDDQYSNAYNCYSNAALTVTTQCYSSSGIGTGELTLADHANGLATLARMGNAIPSTYILKITDSNGKNIYTYTQPAGSQVINPQTAYIVNNMLSDPNASYFAPSAKFQHWDGWDFAIKTGTAVNNYDYLMVSYSTQYAVVTWVGNHTLNTSMTGSSDALTYVLDHGLMTYLHTGLTADNWAQPAGIQHLPAYVMTNITPSLFFSAIGPSPSTDIYPSWYKPNTGSGGTQTIDKVSGLLATGCTPADAKETVGHTNANTFSIDQFYGTTASTSSSGVVGNDNVHNCSDSPPSIGAIDVSGQDVLGGGSATCTGTCTISATPLQGTHLLNDPTNYPQYPGTLTITANGNTICSSDNITSGVPFQCSYTPSSSFDGPITATVTDSVLYQSSSSSVNVNFVVGSSGNSGGGGGGGGSTITGTAISSAGKTTISWTGGSAPYTVTDNNAINNPICTGSSITTSGTSDSCIVETAPNALPGSTVTITDTDGDTSSPIKVTT
jgi:membrane peptidoglycan carboxypeptidase